MKDLAVIMSVYKNDKLSFVKLAVESILEQSLSDFNFYIQADGKLSEELYHYFESIEDQRLIFRRREENKGLANSLNELLSVVLKKQYNFIARMDADDISLNNRLEKQINFLKTHPEVDVVGTWAIEINEQGDEFFRKTMPISHQECRNFFLKRDCLIHPTVLFRKSYFEKAGLYPTDTFFAEDTKMWQNGFINGCIFSNLPEFLFKFRLDSNFFNRRRGWDYAKNIYTLRAEITKNMNYGIKGYIYAVLYAGAKMMPTKLLSLIYKKTR